MHFNTIFLNCIMCSYSFCYTRIWNNIMRNHSELPVLCSYMHVKWMIKNLHWHLNLMLVSTFYNEIWYYMWTDKLTCVAFSAISFWRSWTATWHISHVIRSLRIFGAAVSVINRSINQFIYKYFILLPWRRDGLSQKLTIFYFNVRVHFYF